MGSAERSIAAHSATGPGRTAEGPGLEAPPGAPVEVVEGHSEGPGRAGGFRVGRCYRGFAARGEGRNTCI